MVLLARQQQQQQHRRLCLLLPLPLQRRCPLVRPLLLTAGQQLLQLLECAGQGVRPQQLVRGCCCLRQQQQPSRPAAAWQQQQQLPAGLLQQCVTHKHNLLAHLAW
jgi:hypothetical protein